MPFFLNVQFGSSPWRGFIDTCPLIPLLLATLLGSTLSAAEEPTFSKLPDRGDGWQRLQIVSSWQSEPTQLRIREPKRQATSPLPVLYVLPVEAGEETTWGDPLKALAACDAALLDRAIIAAPTYAQLPWFADHPSDPGVQQESYLLKAVVPYMDNHFPVTDRSLVGFSKSGWGAWSLLLRYPQTFARAVAWDAPLMTDTIDRYGMRSIFGTVERLRDYQITRLVAKRAKSWQPKRLALFGNSHFLAEHQTMHALLQELTMPHTFAIGLKREHHWETGWLESALRFLLDGELGSD